MKPVRTAIDVIAMTALTLLALAPLSAAYLTTDFWIAAAGGVVLGAGIALTGALLRWRTLSLAAITVIAYFAFGGLLVFRSHALFGVVPTLDVLAALALGVVQVWKQALTLPTPFTGFDQLTLVPYLAGLVVAVVAVSLALRVRRFGFALLPIGLLLLGSIAFSTYRGFFPTAVGAAFAAVAIGWAAWRGHRRRADRTEDLSVVGEDGHGSRARTLALSGIGVVVAATLVGGAAAATASGAISREVLREYVEPPLELHDYASPLTSFRKLVKDMKDTELFTVTGLPAGTPIRLATLDLYDGVVYKVSGGPASGAGVFARVGREIENTTTGESAEVSIEIHELTGVWLPTVGYLDAVALDSDADPDALHYNSVSGTAVLTTGVAPGTSYTLDVTIPPQPDPAAIDGAELADLRTPEPEKVPEPLPSMLDSVVADATTPLEQIRALEEHFQSGYFSHGLEGEGQAPSRSGHGVSRQAELLSATQMVGDDEQYAVAMALAVSQLGIPARVVMGFTPDSDGSAVAVTGDHLHAWVEIPFDRFGWVAFNPTPSDENELTELSPQPQQKPRVQVAQPPDVPQEPAELPPTPPIEEAQDGDEVLDLAWLWAALRIGAIGLGVLALLLVPTIVLAIVRARRRKRRARAATTVGRVDGGWAELVDSATDAGYPLTRGATRREQGAVLEVRAPEAQARSLALRADAAVFGSLEPTAEDVARYWADVDTARKRIAAAAPWRQRVLARFFPRSALRALRPRRRRAPEDRR